MSSTVASTTPPPQRPSTRACAPDSPPLRPSLTFAATALVVGWALLGPAAASVMTRTSARR